MSSVTALIAGAGVLATAGAARRAIDSRHRGRATMRLRAEAAGRKRWAVKWLPAPAWVVSGLDRSAIALPADATWSLWVTTTMLAGVAAALFAGTGPAVIVILGFAVGPALGVGSRRDEAARRLDAGVPAAMESIARSLRSGASMRQAIAETASETPDPLGAELGTAARASSHGEPLVACLDRLGARHRVPSVRLAVTALCLGIEAGGSQACAIDGVATTLRERLAVTAELRALSSQARISALVIGVAPLVFGGFAMLTDPRTADFLLHTGMGWMLVGVGLALDALGWLWMRRLCRQGATS